jgi:tetratricopeptide (TPR) repeat protein
MHIEGIISMKDNIAVMNDKLRYGAILFIGGVLYAAYSYFSEIDGAITIRFGPALLGLISLVMGLAEEKQSREHDELMKRTSYEQTAKEDWNKDGNEFFSLGNYHEAIKSFDMALERDPRYLNAWVNKGSSLLKLGRYSEALAAYDEAIRIDPQSALAWNRKGLALKKLDLPADAASAYSRARELGYTE